MLEVAEASFKRQLDHDESLWRSVPLFAAGFALATALVGRASEVLPPFEWTIYSSTCHGLFFLSVIAFAWSGNWLWRIVRQRFYEYPAPDAEILSYARNLTAYHEAVAPDDDSVDERVVHELRLEMVTQYGDAATANFILNADRMKARSNGLLYMLVGFVLAFAFQATIFVHAGTYGSAAESGFKDHGRPSPITPPASVGTALSPGSAKSALGSGRSKLFRVPLQSGHREKAMTKDRTPVPPTAAASPVTRPTPPKPLIMAKDSQINETAGFKLGSGQSSKQKE